MNQRSTKPVGLPNIDNELTYDKSNTKAFSEVDTDGDGKISEAEVKALLEKEHLYKRLTKTLGITNLATAIVSACLCFAFVYSIKDTASTSGNLVDQSNGNALHTALKEEFAPVTIDEAALDGFQVLPAGSLSASATRTEVGTLSKSGFLIHIKNAETNTASGFAQYKKIDGVTTKLVPYQATETVKTKDGTDVSIEVEIKDGGKIRYLQFGVACKDSATKCSVFALVRPSTEADNRKLMRQRSGAGLDSDSFERALWSKDPPPKRLSYEQVHGYDYEQ
jgi:hypothetical protein